MKMKFRFKGPRREVDFRCDGRDRFFRQALTILGRALLLAAVIAAKTMLGL